MQYWLDTVAFALPKTLGEVFDATCGMYTRVMHYWLDTVAFALPPTLGEVFHSPVRMPFTRHQISSFLVTNGEYFGHHWASLDSK